MKTAKPRRNWQRAGSFRVILFLAILGAMFTGFRFYDTATEAATPASGDLNATLTDSETWVGDRLIPTSAGNGEPTCTTGDATALNCDVYTLTALPGSWSGKRITVTFTWQEVANDYDMVVRRETNGIPGMQVTV